jgi:hypothetical protein
MSDVTSMNNHFLVCQNLLGMDVSCVYNMIFNFHMELAHSPSRVCARIAYGSFYMQER